MSDLIRFSPDSDDCFPFLQWACLQPGLSDTNNIAELLQTIFSSQKKAGTSEGEQIWKTKELEFFQRVVALCRAGTGNRVLSIRMIDEVLKTAPQRPEMVEQLRDGLCLQLITQGEARQEHRDMSDEETIDFLMAKDYFLHSWPSMPPDMRGSVEGGLTGSLSLLLSGSFYHKLVEPKEGALLITPDDILDDGKTTVADYPTLTTGATGKLVQTILKACFFEAVQRRTDTSRSVFWYADEAQETLLEGGTKDAAFQRIARGYGCAVISLTQSTAGFLDVMGGGPKAEATLNSLLDNYAVWIVHAIKGETAERVSKVIGKSWQEDVRTVQHGETDNHGPQGHGSTNMSVSMQREYRAIVEPSDFTTLRQGGHANDLQCDAYVFTPGHVLSNGQTVMRTTFLQEDKRRSETAGIRCRCPHCEFGLTFDAAAAGLMATCPTCRRPMTVPRLSG